MKYLYKCNNCGNKTEISKPMADAGKDEYCSCGEKLQRVFIPLGVTWHDNCRFYNNEGMGDELVLTHHD